VATVSAAPDRLGLAARVVLGAMAIIFVIAVALTWFIVHTDRETYLQDHGATLVNGVTRNAERLGRSVEALRRDALVLSHLPPIQGILRALRNRGRDPQEAVPLKFWTTRLGEIFSSFAESNPEYFQIRYIGVADKGRELVRVDQTEGRVAVMPPEKLQSKGDRDYFQETLKLHAGEVYVSEIDLNRELGRIQVPHLRTLRAATPVFTPDGDLFGIVVVNMDIGPALDYATTNLPRGTSGYMVNSQGDYLAHPDAGRTFGFDLGRRYTRQQDMPGLQVPSIPGPGQRPQAVSTPAGLLHVAVERVNFDPARSERFILLAWALPDAVIETRMADVRNATIAVMLVIALSVGGMVFVLLRRAFVPLARLTALAESIGAGRYDVALPAQGAGEIGTFVRAFGSMLERLSVREREIKKANTALEESEARLQTIFENLSEGVAVFDLDGGALHFNRAAIEMHGFAGRDEYLRRLAEFADTFELSAPEGAILPVDQWPLARILRGEALRDLEIRIRRIHNGWQRVFSYGGTLARNTDGQPMMAVVTIGNITARKEAEQRIRGQLEHLNLLDHITRAIGERQDLRSIFQVVVGSLEDSLSIDFGCVCLHDQAANALRVTCVGAKSEPLARELTMDERASIEVDDNGLGRCVQGQLVYEPDIGNVEFPFPQRLARGGLRSLVMAPLRAESRVFGVLVAARREANAFSSVECEFLRQLSEHVALAAHQAQLYGALQQAYDDLRQTQQAVMQQERLRSLGQMASGIAHDINNALSPVSLYAESMLETERNLSDRGRGYLQTIQRAVEDVAQTVARMREFYRQREVQLALTPVQMNSMVQQVVDLTRARWNDMPQQRGIVIRTLTELAPDLPMIMGVESEIREALTNVVFNAVDAMPEGGTLMLRTRVADASSERAAVVVEVADNGIGMDEDTRRRCLEPFFTTKGERGTGLGLAMVFGMVQRHSAELEIESAPGAGTTVRFVLAVPTSVPPEPGQPLEALEAPSRLRLLLIDDDPILLKSLQDALETDGHVIVTANGGGEGVSAFRIALERGEAFAAVITDLGMPHVDGRRVAAAVKEISPATPVILLTGWGQRLVAEGDIPPHVDRVLAKPPKLRELRDALARLCRPEPA
jgi:signal transduction histidine kinase/CheY-like chemotaxis protein/PAS domain-containing protein